MENMEIDYFWKNKRVLITGHTGFKGSWLTCLLIQKGASICGISLNPETNPSMFSEINILDQIDHNIIDINDSKLIKEKVGSFRPEVILHLAAQALVTTSYEDPRDTWLVNVMGTATLLDCLRSYEEKCAVVVITTDKVYRNNEWDFSYRECDTLGGHDPYSASKAACELVVDSFRSSFFNKSYINLASARAGNVIGGGDWSKNRIIPDMVRSLSDDEGKLSVRNPNSVRPWQHVLDPLHGYLVLAEELWNDNQLACCSFNFGPYQTDNRSVSEVILESSKYCNIDWESPFSSGGYHEAGILKLSIEKSEAVLGWRPNWSFSDAVRETMSWYSDYLEGKNMLAVTMYQIEKFYKEIRV